MTLAEAMRRIMARGREVKIGVTLSNGYPLGWPRCPGCGQPALDGHITCGRVECDEGGRRG